MIGCQGRRTLGYGGQIISNVIRNVEMRDNFGIVSLGDDATNILLTYADLRAALPRPRDLPAARQAMFGPTMPRPASLSLLRWLASDAGVVPIQPRDDVDELTRWALDGTAPLVRLITGAGGQGKTVLGGLVRDRVTAAGHVAGFVRLPRVDWRSTDATSPVAVHRQQWLTRWTEIIAGALAAAELGQGCVLLIVDYAENQLDAVADLLSALIAAQSAHGQVKALLLSRYHQGWWPQLAALHPEHRWVEPQPLALPSLLEELGPQQSAAVWTSAVDAFAQAADTAGLPLDGSAPMTPAQAPSSLAFETTLDLYATALLCVLDARTTTPARRHHSDPLAGVLDHEQKILANALASLDVNATPEQLAQVLLAAYLVPAADTTEGSAILACAPTLTAWASTHPTVGGYETVTRLAATQVGRLYPDTGDGLWMAPVPDRLPDTHLLRVLHDEPSDGDAISLVTTLGARARSEGQMSHLVAALGRSLGTPAATIRYPDGIRRVEKAAHALLVANPDGLLAPVIDQEHRGLDRAVIDAIQMLSRKSITDARNTLFGRGFSLSRTTLKLEISRRLVDLHREENPDRQVDQSILASDLIYLSISLAESGFRRDSLVTAQEATDLQRDLARANPDVYLPNLAVAMLNLAIDLNMAGRRAEGLAAAEEAADLFRDLARGNPEVYLPNLAASVSTLAVQLAEAGRQAEGLTNAEEAVRIRRDLVRANPDANLPELAMSVNNLAVRLAEAGRQAEGLAAAQEAADLCRDLAQTNPDAYLPNLAMSVNNLANRLAEAGRQAEGLAAAEEAVRIRRDLVRSNPNAYLSDLAGSVYNLAADLAEAGRQAEGLAAGEEAADLYRDLARTNPNVYLPDLARSVNNLAVDLAEAGRQTEGLAAAQEAVDLYRDLARIDPDAYLSDLATSVNNLVDRLTEAGRQTEALAAAEEAVDLNRGLARSHPHLYLPNLAGSVNNLAVHLAEAERQAEALAAAEEAVDLYRDSARTNPDAYLSDLAGSVNNLANRLAEAGRQAEGLAAAEEAVRIRRDLARGNPNAYLSDLAGSVNDLADRLAEAGQQTEALAAAQETADLYRDLAQTNPNTYLPELARSVNNLAVDLAEAGRQPEGLTAAQEAVDLYRDLAQTNPNAYLPDLAMSVYNLAADLAAAGRQTEGLAAAEEAADLYRDLARYHPDLHLPNLAASVNNLAGRLAEAGRQAEGLVAGQEAADLYRDLARTNPDAYLPDLTMSLNNLAVQLAAAGRGQEVDATWWQAARGQTDSAQAIWETLRAGWEWVRTPDYHSERQYLRAHQSKLLADDSETLLVSVLRNLPSEEAQRYLQILAVAREHSIDAAYRQIPELS